MVEDQVDHLLVRAATTGAVDFRRADPYDPQWVAHLNLVLPELARRETVTWATTLYQHYLSLMEIASRNGKDVKQLYDVVDKLLSVITQQQAPWVSATEKQTRREKIAGAISEWETRFGKLSDPKVQQAIDDTVAAVRAYRAAEAQRREREREAALSRMKNTRMERHRVTRNRRRA